MDGLLAMRGGPNYAYLAGTHRVYDRRQAMSRAPNTLINLIFQPFVVTARCARIAETAARRSRRAM